MNMVKVHNNPIARNHRHLGHPFASFDRLFNECLGEEAHCAWTPRTDIAETDKEHQLIIELPGLDKEDINIKVEDRVLMLSGEVKSDDETEERRIRRRERFSGSFNRRFRLPVGIEVDKISAEFKNGLLTVSLPKSEAAVGREIEVK